MKHDGRYRVRSVCKTLAAAAVLIAALPAFAAPKAPSDIKIGTLYASSGPFATSSQSQYEGLKFWAAQQNKQGGVYVKAFGKHIPVKLVAYDDQSKTGLAGNLYTQLITRDHVNVLVADFGSVLTSVAVPIARVHKKLLFDVTGTSGKFFTSDNPYVVLTSLPTSSVWPETLGDFLINKKIGKVAVLYATNDFDQSQADTLRRILTKARMAPAYFHGVPTSTSSYSVLLHTIASHHPDAVVEFGYPNNDIAFLRDLSESGLHFKMVFTVFPGQLLSLLEKNVGVAGLAYTFTYPTPPLLRYEHVTYGPSISEFESEYQKATGKSVDFLTVAGYNAGLVIQKTLAESSSLGSRAMRKAVASFSGKLKTLNGEFKINQHGAQIGETLPVGQLIPKGKGLEVRVVYPPHVANGSAVYPAPASGH